MSIVLTEFEINSMKNESLVRLKPTFFYQHLPPTALPPCAVKAGGRKLLTVVVLPVSNIRQVRYQGCSCAMRLNMFIYLIMPSEIYL